MEKFLGNFLIESPKADFMAILDACEAIPRSDSMDLVESVETFPGNSLTYSKSAGVILSTLSTLSTNFQDICSQDPKQSLNFLLLLELWQGYATGISGIL